MISGSNNNSKKIDMFRKYFAPNTKEKQESCDLILSNGDASDCLEKESGLITKRFDINDKTFYIDLNHEHLPDIDEDVLLTYNGKDGEVFSEPFTSNKTIEFEVKENKDGTLTSAPHLSIHSSTFRTSCTYKYDVEENVFDNFLIEKDGDDDSYILSYNKDTDYASIDLDQFDIKWYFNGEKISNEVDSGVTISYIRANGVSGKNKLTVFVNDKLVDQKTYITHGANDLGLRLEQKTVINGYEYWYNIIPYEDAGSNFVVKMYKNNTLIEDEIAYTNNPNDRYQLVAFAQGKQIPTEFDRNNFISFDAFTELEIRPKDINEILKLGFNRIENEELIRNYDDTENLSFQKEKVLEPHIDERYILDYKIVEDPILSALKTVNRIDEMNASDVLGPDDLHKYYYSDKDGNPIEVPLKQSIEKVVEVIDLEESYVASTIDEFDTNNVAYPGTMKLEMTEDGFFKSDASTILERDFNQNENLTRVQFEYYGLATSNSSAKIKVEFFKADNTLITEAGIKPTGDLNGWIIYGDGEDKTVNGYLYHDILNIPLENHMDIAKMKLTFASRRDNQENDSLFMKDFIITLLK